MGSDFFCVEKVTATATATPKGRRGIVIAYLGQKLFEVTVEDPCVSRLSGSHAVVVLVTLVVMAHWCETKNEKAPSLVADTGRAARATDTSGNLFNSALFCSAMLCSTTIHDSWGHFCRDIDAGVPDNGGSNSQQQQYKQQQQQEALLTGRFGTDAHFSFGTYETTNLH